MKGRTQPSLFFFFFFFFANFRRASMDKAQIITRTTYERTFVRTGYPPAALICLFGPFIVMANKVLSQPKQY